jgi:CheY-like chemotaxis protein
MDRGTILDVLITPQPKKPGVLVVDGDQLARTRRKRGLERNGWNIWLAADGYEAVELYWDHKENIAVVVLDDCMPGLGGPETLEALRSLNSEVLVCLMSVEPDGYGPEDLLPVGAPHVFAKPIRPDQFAQLLHQLVANRPNVDRSPASNT